MQLTQADQLPDKSGSLDTSSTMISSLDSLPPVGYPSTALGKRRAEDPSIGEPIGPSESSYDVQQMNGASGFLKSQIRARTGAKRARMILPTLGKRVRRKYLFEGPAPQNNNSSPPFTFVYSTSSSVPFHSQDVDRHTFPLSGRDSGPSRVAADVFVQRPFLSPPSSPEGLQSNDRSLWADGSDAEDEDITEALPESKLHRRLPPSNRSRSPRLIAPTGSIPPQISHHPKRTLNEDGGDADDEEENERPTQGPREVHADAGQALSEVPASLNHQKVDIGATMNVDTHSIRPAATQRVPPRVGVEEVTDEEFNRPSTACGPSIGSLHSPAHTPTHNVPRPPSQSRDNTDSSTPHSAQCPTKYQKVVETVDASAGAAPQKKQSTPLHLNSEKAHPKESNRQSSATLPGPEVNAQTRHPPQTYVEVDDDDEAVSSLTESDIGTQTPAPEHSATNANERFLRDEIIRLIETEVKTRNMLLTRRIEAFYQVHPSLAKLDELAEVITLLTAEAISGDETADGSSRHKYFITKVEWRSKELSDFLGYLTALHLCGRYIGTGKFQKGAFPKARYASTRPESIYDKDVAPKHLPINWYDPKWLKVHPMRVKAVQPAKAVPLTLPAPVLK
ncbi:hypothetical protein LENED_008963 [Lentinula edodes]|uniref:Uncharacterized protein n=1 Tax=Lentinula edodes TaxID=5353 RepID=A0A1Q3EII1_LENED|nr:hypothetical protein LENED_008963 [Lentinula edodes]